jgi:hypothetical protein
MRSDPASHGDQAPHAATPVPPDYGRITIFSMSRLAPWGIGAWQITSSDENWLHFFLIWEGAANKRLADTEEKRLYDSTCLIDVNSLFRIVRIQNN